MNSEQLRQSFALDYPSQSFGSTLAVHADSFDWMRRVPRESVHAIVTDPPYGVKEYDFDRAESARHPGVGSDCHR